MSRLYEINKELEDLFNEFDTLEDPELRAAFIARIEEVALSRDEKIEAWVCYIKNQVAESEKFEAEAERLQKTADRLKESAQHSKERLQELLEPGIKWEKSPHLLTWRKSEAVKILDEKAIPMTYMKETLEYSPKKKEILDDLKIGAVIPGVEIEKRLNLQIK